MMSNCSRDPWMVGLQLQGKPSEGQSRDSRAQFAFSLSFLPAFETSA